MTTLLQVRDLAKKRGRTQVLTRASFEVAAGELVGIVGENGSGKSTLLEILVGRLRRDSGEVQITDTLGYCPQQARVFERLTVRENLELFGTAYGLTDWEQRTHTLLSRYRFERWLDTPVAEVSGGTRQKLNLCVALLHAPRLLILDEPYAGFDWETYLHFWEHAGELRQGGTGLLIVSHLLHDLERFDRVYQLVEGELR